MARRALARTRTVYVPKVRYVRRGRRRYRATARGIAGFALGLPPTGGAMVGAGVLAWGLSEGSGAMMANWKVGKLSVPWTVGLGAYVAARWTGSPFLRHMATGILSVAAYNTVAAGSILGEGDYDDVSGLSADV